MGEFAEDFDRIRSEFSWEPSRLLFETNPILENFIKEDTQLYRRAETREKWLDAARPILSVALLN